MDTFVAKPRFLEPTFQEKRKRPENQNGNLTVEEVEFQGAVVGTLDATEDVVVVDDFPTMTALQKPVRCSDGFFVRHYLQVLGSRTTATVNYFHFHMQDASKESFAFPRIHCLQRPSKSGSCHYFQANSRAFSGSELKACRKRRQKNQNPRKLQHRGQNGQKSGRSKSQCLTSRRNRSSYRWWR